MSSFANQAEVDQPKATEGQSFSQEQPQDQEAVLRVGDREYKSLDEVKTKVEHQDTHISKLEREAQEYREELAKLRAKLEESTQAEDVLARMKEKESTQQGLDPNQLDDVVTNKYQELKQKEAREANHQSCSQALKEAYGDNYITELKKMADAEGLSMVEVDEFAYTKPQLFKKLFLTGQKSSTSNNSVPTSTVRSANYQETPVTDDIKAPMSLNSTKARTNNYLKALEKHLTQN